MSNTQFGRKCSLVLYAAPPPPGGSGIPTTSSSGGGSASTVTPQSQPGIELGTLRVHFHVSAMDVDAPPTTIIRVINLSDATAKLAAEYSGVVLQAGYEGGNFGVIFKGSVVRTRKGRLNNIETFLDIMASNWDLPFNFGFLNGTIAAGSTAQTRAQQIVSQGNSSPAMQSADAKAALAGQQAFQLGNIPNSFGTGGTLPRGKVIFGLARDYLNDLTASKGTTWHISPDGKINILEYTGYLPQEPVEINAATGMIGVPEATQQGIEVECLLNPNIKVGTRIKLNNADINISTNQSAFGFPNYDGFAFFANTSNDGIYRVLVVEHEGDSRGSGDDWKTKIIALALDQSVTPGASTKTALGAYP